MPVEKEKKKITQKLKAAALGILAGDPLTGAEPFGGDWPWCMGIVYQPKHPLLKEQENLQTEK